MENRQQIQAQEQDLKVWPKVAIIVLNWNGWRDTIECLESLQRITYPNYQIIVVDNGSTDGSIEKIKDWARGNLSVKPNIIQTGENLGFAGGNNIGIKHALQQDMDYIWLLNNDTVVLPNTLTLLISQAMSIPNLGIISPKILFYSSPNRVWFAGGKLVVLRAAGYNLGLGRSDNSSYSGLMPCTFITGCSMLIRREVFESIGLLDPSYFLYVEDVDFSWRAINAQWDLATHLDAVVYHKASSALGGDQSHLQTYYISRNRLYFSAKHHSRFQGMTFNLFWILSRVTKFSLWIVKGRIDLITATIQGYIDYKKGHMGYHAIRQD